MLVFCRTIMLNVFIKRFYVNLKEDFIREVRFLDVIKKDTVLFFDKLTKITKHAKRHFWLNDVCTCHGLLPSHSA